MPDSTLISTLRRHDLLRVDPKGWAATLRCHPHLAAVPLLADWAANRRPVMVRRPLGSDRPGFVPAAVALPPSCGKLRIGLEIEPAFLIERMRSIEPSEARGAAPAAWQSVLNDVARIARMHNAHVSLFGSFMWQAITGLKYLTRSSDIDLIWRVSSVRRLPSLLDAIAEVDAQSPMRIDGEIVLPDGGGINWRELHRNPHEVMVKTMSGIECRALSTLLECEGTAA
jgi:phosphoribosyl-dephospho-CoA transferase